MAGGGQTSPQRTHGRIIHENEQKLRQAVEENEALRLLCEKKQVEQDKVSYKC